MSLVNKSFKNNITGEIVRIIDSYQNIAITDKKERIDATRLMDNKYYTEYIDPKSFFQDSGTYNLFAEKIKSVDLTRVPLEESKTTQTETINLASIDGFTPTTNESAVVMYDPEDEKAELMRKYGATNDNSSAQFKQQQAFAKLLDEEIIEPQLSPQKSEPVKTQKDSVERINFEDPIITMFKNAKKNVDFSVNLKVEGKIPRLDFIEMMEDTYEISIIEFLADEFTQQLLKNPHHLKMKIIDEIKKKVNQSKTEKQSNLVDSESSEITKKTTRKKLPLGPK